MGISDWRAKRQMKYPERGVFRVTGSSDANPYAPSAATRVTGIITAPGIPDTQVEHKSDDHDRWVGVKEVPVLVDRADPSKFVILWDEAMPMSWQDQDPRVTVATTGPDGQYTNTPVAPEMAAQLQARLGKLLNKTGGGAGVLGEMLNQAIGQAIDQFGPQGSNQAGRQYGQPTPQSYNQSTGQPAAQPYGQPPAQPYGQPAAQPFGQVDPDAFAQTPPQAYGQSAQPCGQVDPQAFSQPAPQSFDQPAPQSPSQADLQAYGQPAQRGAGWQQPTWSESQASDGFIPGGAGPSAAAGEQASAVVLSAQDVAAPGYGVSAGLVDLTLEVTRANGYAYTAPARMSFSTPEQRAAVATPGARLRVRVDPNAPTRVTIDPF